MVALLKLKAAPEALISMPSPLVEVPATVTAPPLKLPPPLLVTLVNDRASAFATVPVAMLANVMLPAGMVTPFKTIPWPVVVVVIVLLAPATLIEPPPVPLNPTPVVVSMFSPPPEKLIVAAGVGAQGHRRIRPRC